jgi:hypothetical protein
VFGDSSKNLDWRLKVKPKFAHMTRGMTGLKELEEHLLKEAGIVVDRSIPDSVVSKLADKAVEQYQKTHDLVMREMAEKDPVKREELSEISSQALDDLSTTCREIAKARGLMPIIMTGIESHDLEGMQFMLNLILKDSGGRLEVIEGGHDCEHCPDEIKRDCVLPDKKQKEKKPEFFEFPGSTKLND